MSHFAELSPVSGQFTYWIRDAVIARSTRAIKLIETIDDKVLPPIIYIPIEDLNEKLLIPSDHVTHCPLKGDAHYWHLSLTTDKLPNSVWYYPDPYPEVGAIHGYAAFLPEVVNIECD